MSKPATVTQDWCVYLNDAGPGRNFRSLKKAWSWAVQHKYALVCRTTERSNKRRTSVHINDRIYEWGGSHE